MTICKKKVVTGVVILLQTLVCNIGSANGFQGITSTKHRRTGPLAATAATTADTIETSVARLKKVLEKEYITFFDPMERDYYDPSVTFEDPMTTLSGIDAYQKNVDMLSSRTLMGSILFNDAGIVLHSVKGGDVTVAAGGGVQISNIITRWTLRFCFKALPWKPNARFSGISVYDVRPGGKEGVVITKQTDYWDSINIQQGGSYAKVDKNVAVSHFIDQIKPNNFNAPSAGPELPYQLLRAGDGYEVRRFPAYSTVKIPYTRRDEAFGTLGAFTSGIGALSPAIMDIEEDGSKSMMWPMDYAPPSVTMESLSPEAKEKVKEDRWTNFNCEIVTVPSKVVAVGSFSDASVEPVVRKCDRELREAIARDGIVIPDATKAKVKFAQYDAIFSMGKRRGEVWIELEDGGHPW